MCLVASLPFKIVLGGNFQILFGQILLDMVSGWSGHGYRQWWPVPGTAVIFSGIHARLGHLGRGVCPPLSLSPPRHLSADHSSHLPPLQVPKWDSPHQCQASRPIPLSPCSYVLSWKSPVLWAEKVRELLPNVYCLETVLVLAFYTRHSSEVFGGNTKINILIKWLLILLKQTWTAIYQNAKFNNTVVQLLY